MTTIHTTSKILAEAVLGRNAKALGAADGLAAANFGCYAGTKIPLYALTGKESVWVDAFGNVSDDDGGRVVDRLTLRCRLGASDLARLRAMVSA